MAIGNNIVAKKTTELVLLFHKKTTKLVFLWPDMSQKSFKVLKTKNLIMQNNLCEVKSILKISLVVYKNFMLHRKLCTSWTILFGTSTKYSKFMINGTHHKCNKSSTDKESSQLLDKEILLKN